jgi:hypothetical protein
MVTKVKSFNRFADTDTSTSLTLGNSPDGDRQH